MKKRSLAIMIFIVLIAILTVPVYATSSRYNLRDYINIPIKNQNGTGSCWILAMSTVFETNLALKHGVKYEVSARHMDYATSQSFTNGTKNPMGFAKEVDKGGNADVALAYLTNGSGPISESEMPFSTTFGDIDISEIQGKNIEYQLKQWVRFPIIIKKENGIYTNEEGNEYTDTQVANIREQVKHHITENGAVYAGIYAATGFTEFYNPKTYAYNCNDYTKTTDHAVVIIGWDDNYSKENFKEGHRPNTDGAYIVQNSWGDDPRLNHGTFYVSYEDSVIETGLYGIVDIQKKQYDKIYQYDELGSNQYFNVTNITEAYGANVFEREKEKREYLSQIAISTYMSVECEIYINTVDGSLKSGLLTKIKEARLSPGYNTIDLDNKVQLTGEKFAIVVKYKKVDDILGVTTISRYDEQMEGNPYINHTSAIGQSYIGTSIQGLKDLREAESPDTNVCIKAFTNYLLLGDISGDGAFTARDLAMLQAYMVKLIELENPDVADLNGDGKYTASDISILMQMLVGLV